MLMHICDSSTTQCIQLELCNDVLIGMLSDGTRIFRENGLSVTRVDVATRGSKAVNGFYLTCTSMYLVKSETIDDLRRERALLIHGVKDDDAYSISPPQQTGKFSLGNIFRSRSKKFLYNLSLIKSIHEEFSCNGSGGGPVVLVCLYILKKKKTLTFNHSVCSSS